MAVTGKVEGVDRLVKQLDGRGRRIGVPLAPVEVGYASPYALPVHENRQMAWRGKPRPSGIGSYWDAKGGQGRAGFLLDVAREMNRELTEAIRSGIKRGWTIAQACLAAGRMLQRASQKEVPYEHGDLQKSAFTKLREQQ